MKPSELFEGAVCAWEGDIYTIVAYDRGLVTLEENEKVYIGVECDLISPLPISPAVLRGLGFEFDDESNAFVHNVLSVYWDELFWNLDGDNEPIVIEFAHQLQALSFHGCGGIELVWNQEEYDKAMKEDAK